jgi:hypothetical protein
MVECPTAKLAIFFMRGQFTLRHAFVVIAWLCVTLGIYRLVPLPRDGILFYWLGATIFVCSIGVSLGGAFGRPILGGVLGAILGLLFAVLSVQ